MRKKEAEILKIIINYSKNGIHHVELAKKIGIDKKESNSTYDKTNRQRVNKKRIWQAGKIFSHRSSLLEILGSAQMFLVANLV